MRPLVKVCGITQPQDAELALELGADFVGVILYKDSPRCVQPQMLKELVSVIPPEKLVLVDVATATDELEQHLDIDFGSFQMHFDMNIGLATVAAWAGMIGADRLWLAPRIPSDERYFPQMVMEFCHTVLIDGYSNKAFGGTGHTANWQRFIDWSTLYQHKRWALAGGISPENILDAIRCTDPAIIDVNSGVESAPGIKSHDLLRKLFSQLKQS
jgi:phosphoribosylanthranilate isomerase